MNVETEKKSPRGERATEEAIANGFLMENGEKQPQKQPNLSVSDFPTMVTWNVYQAIKLNRKAKYSWLQDNLGVSESTILRAIKDLKELGYIDPEHSKVKGEWQLLK